MPSSTNSCANVLGVGISAVDMAQSISACDDLITRKEKGYVVLPECMESWRRGRPESPHHP